MFNGFKNQLVIKFIFLSLFGLNGYGMSDAFAYHGDLKFLPSPPETLSTISRDDLINKSSRQGITNGVLTPITVLKPEYSAFMADSILSFIKSYSFKPFPELAVTSDFFSVNNQLDSLLDPISEINITPPIKYAFSYTWTPSIVGLKSLNHGDRGTCSDIPVYLDYMGILDYKFMIKLSIYDGDQLKSQFPVLEVHVTDHNGVLLQSECWRLGNKQQLIRQIHNNDNLSGDLATNFSSINSEINNWLSLNGPEFIDDVQANLTPKNDVAGKPVFDGEVKTWNAVSSPNSRFEISWKFISDPQLSKIFNIAR